METLIHKYTNKLCRHNLTEVGAPLLGALEADLIWNRRDEKTAVLEKVFDHVNINSLLFAEPKEPYKTIIDYLVSLGEKAIRPEDCETRTFLHDLPIATHFDTESIVADLKRRKSVIVKDHGIITFGTVTPEQAFVVYSSVCFATFVKFFSDYLKHVKSGNVTPEEQAVFEKVVPMLKPLPESFAPLKKGPFTNEEDVYVAMAEAGKLTVDYGLVDSYFGNISYKFNNTLYISQTTSSLDELAGCIDPCPLNNSSCAGITASSELSAHKQIVLETDVNAILHGHPKFSVILSMDCDVDDCELEDVCHIKCPYPRFINDIPVVPGEVGTGRYGLYKTMPPAVKGKRGAIVYGHGLFTTSSTDFNRAFQSMLDVEKECRSEYFKRFGR